MSVVTDAERKRTNALRERERRCRALGLATDPSTYQPRQCVSAVEAECLAARVASDFGHWFAGFFAGEGSVDIAKARGDARHCIARITLRADDENVLRLIAEQLGIGRVAMGRASNGNAVAHWAVKSRSDARVLAAIFGRFPLRAKKASDVRVWRRAVAVWCAMDTMSGSRESRAQGNAECWQELAELAVELRAARKP